MPKLGTLNARRLQWDFSTSPKYWFEECVGRTHFLNTYTLLVPDNEKYYIRTLTKCLSRLSDPHFKAVLLQFFQQESLHGIAHKKYWSEFPNHDIYIETFVKAVNIFLYGILEKLSPLPLRVSIVAAIEHLNASWANYFLSRANFNHSESQVVQLFNWHFAEEIEHKSVAHEVLEKLYPYYLLRVVGACLAFPIFYLLMAAGTCFLLAGDKQLFNLSAWKGLYYLLIKNNFLKHNVFLIIRYFGKNFHPSNINDYGLAKEILSQYAPAHWSFTSSQHEERARSY